MRFLKKNVKDNKELIESLSSELGIPEEQIPTIVDHIVKHPKFQKEIVGRVLEHQQFTDALSDKLAKDEKVRSRVAETMSKFFGRRSFLEALVAGGAIAAGLSGLARGETVITDKNVIINDEWYLKAPMPYSALVGIEDKVVRAYDWRGKTIAEGEAGVDDVEVIQSAIDEASTQVGHAKISLMGEFVIDQTIIARRAVILDGNRRATLRAKEGITLEDGIIAIEASDWSTDWRIAAQKGMQTQIMRLIIDGNRRNGAVTDGIKLGNTSVAPVINGHAHVDFNIIRDCVVVDCQNGVYIEGSYWNRIEDCHFRGNKTQINFVGYSSANDVMKCGIYGYPQKESGSVGIHLTNHKNLIYDCDIGDLDTGITGGGYYHTIYSCHFENNNIAADFFNMYNVLFINPSYGANPGTIIRFDRVIYFGNPDIFDNSTNPSGTKLPIASICNIRYPYSVFRLDLRREYTAVSGLLKLSDGGEYVDDAAALGGKAVKDSDYGFVWIISDIGVGVDNGVWRLPSGDYIVTVRMKVTDNTISDVIGAVRLYYYDASQGAWTYKNYGIIPTMFPEANKYYSLSFYFTIDQNDIIKSIFFDRYSVITLTTCNIYFDQVIIEPATNYSTFSDYFQMDAKGAIWKMKSLAPLSCRLNVAAGASGVDVFRFTVPTGKTLKVHAIGNGLYNANISVELYNYTNAVSKATTQLFDDTGWTFSAGTDVALRASNADTVNAYDAAPFWLISFV